MFKRTLLALGTMFAGLTAPNVTPAPIFNYGAGETKGRINRTRKVNKDNVHKQKWDFRERTSQGMGYFVNRTTGQWREFKIANPVSTKDNPVRELSRFAQRHFGILGSNA